MLVLAVLLYACANNVCSQMINDNIRHVRANIFGRSSGSGVAQQTCGTDRFYCKHDTEMCKPRTERCTGSGSCINPTTMTEDACLETSGLGKYTVQRGHSTLSSSSSSRKRQYKFEHQFINFRGFTYEFGRSYGVQELDICDPMYKYINGKNLNSKGIRSEGSSYCTRDDVLTFVNMWKQKKYDLFTNNCQHFARALSTVLLHARSTCNTPQNTNQRGKRQANQDLVEYIDMQLTNCSLVCCYETESSAVSIKAENIHIIFVIVTTLAGYILF